MKWLTCALIALGIASCGDSPSLSISEGPMEPGDGPGMRSVRSRQHLTFEGVDGTPVTVGADEMFTKGNPLLGFTMEACELALAEAADASPTGEVCLQHDVGSETAGSCRHLSCQAELIACRASLFLEMATAIEPIELTVNANRQTVQIEPQSEAVSAALAEVAMRIVANHLHHDLEKPLLDSGSAFNLSAGDAPPPDRSSELTCGEQLTADVEGLVDLANEATQEAVRRYVALADQELSRTGSLGDGAMNLQEIRLYAAGLLTGGGSDVVAIRGDACTQPELSPGGARALRTLRMVGLPPAVINSSDTTADLIGKVQYRLGRIRGRASAYDAMTLTEFLADVGNTEEDFAEARAHLIDELAAFRRTSSIGQGTVPEVPSGDDDVIYAATALPPQTPIWLDYAATARFLDSSDPREERRSRGVLAETMGTAFNVLKLLSSASDTATVEAVSRAQPRLARDLEAELSVENVDGSILEVQVLRTIHKETDLVLLTDPNAATCAIRGNIEGVECDWDEHVTPHVKDPASPGVWGPPAGTFYIIRLSSGAPEAIPGSYLPLATGFAPPVGVTDQLFASPRLDEEAGSLLIPSADWCVMPDRECGGFDIYDGRLALEDELTDDGNAFESSWRHYLTLARVSADEADRLGEEALGAAFDINDQVEAAVSELEDICGVSVNLDPVTTALSGSGAGTDPVALVESLIEEEPSLRPLAECLGHVDRIRYAAIGSRELCAWQLDGQEDQLCQLEPGDSTELQCPQAADGLATCPTPTGSGSYTAVRIQNAEPDRLLRLVDATDGGRRRGPDPSLGAHACSTLRVIHDLAANNALSSDPVMSGVALSRADIDFYWGRFVDEAGSFLTGEGLSRLASDIRWEAMPGSYSSIYVGDTVVLTTGSVLDGPNAGRLSNLTFGPDARDCLLNEEPSGSVDLSAVDVPVGDESLFCGAYSLGAGHVDLGDRALLNSRLAAAAIAARWLGGRDLDGFVVPMLRRGWPSNSNRSEASPVDLDWDGLTAFAYRKKEEGTEYCITDGGLVGRVWDFVRMDPDGTGAIQSPSQPTSTACNMGLSRGNRESVRFSTMEGDYVWGQNSVRFDVRERNRHRAQLFAARLSRRDVGTVYHPLHDLLDVGMDAGSVIDTACSFEGDCTGRLNDARFPWVAGQDNDTYIQSQAEDMGVRFFLDRGGATTLPAQAVLDGLELLCQASRAPSLPGRVDVGTVTSQQSMEDAAAELEDVAREVRARAETMVFRDVPRSVVGTLDESSGLGGTANLPGTYGAAALRSRGAIERFAAVPDRMAGVLDGLARDVRVVENAMERSELRGSIAQSNFRSTASGQITRCAVAVLDATIQIAQASTLESGLSGAKTTIMVAAIARAALTCVDSVIQIAEAKKRLEATLDLYELDLNDSFIAFETSVQGRADDLNQLERELRAQANEIQAAFEELESLQRSAARALNRALFLDSDDAGRIYRSHGFLRSRHAIARERYERARERAIGMAWLAKKAIEQRFAVSLATLEEDMSLVEAPARWHNELCSLEGLDFDRLTSTLDDDSPEFADYHYADEYIGEYVSKLEQFVESYRLDYPFQSASDTAVISLRDDIVRTRGYCPVPVRNLLYESGDLEAFAIPETAGDGEPPRLGWSLTGCNAGSCISVRRADVEGPSSIENDGSVTTDPRWSSGIPVPFMVTFRPEILTEAGEENPCADDPDYCGFSTNAIYGQELALEPGTYRVSWYGRDDDPSTDPPSWHDGLDDPANLVQVVREDGSAITGVVSSSVVPARDGVAVASPWTRYHFDFTLSSLSTVRVGLQLTSAPMMPIDALVAGLMLERVEHDTGLPGAWADTGQTREVMQQVCEDTDGVYFRDEGWVRNCVYLCTDGYGATCSGEDAERYCYREIEFVIDQAAIDRGDILSRAGFAIGNFNYRAERVGVNFVGTNLRDCSESENPSTCFASGFVPYSLEHIGPYYARNHLGGDYSAPLFQGTIEHARGLAAERYLTNPISSTDRALVDPYMQTQFRGRPLNGTYRLRIWDVDGIRFENLEDVQVVLDYRFWTRFE